MKTQTLQWMVVGFFALGFIGLMIPFASPFIIMMTPLAIIAVLAILFIGHKGPMNWRLYAALGSVFLLSYLIELLKINLFFGPDVYLWGDSLGTLLWGVPIMVGIAWVALLYVCEAIADSLNVNMILTILIASALALVFDIALELVASHLDLWYWSKGVSMWNYFMWFMVSSLMFTIFKLFDVKINNKIATLVYTSSIAFLLLLSISL